MPGCSRLSFPCRLQMLFYNKRRWHAVSCSFYEAPDCSTVSTLLFILCWFLLASQRWYAMLSKRRKNSQEEQRHMRAVRFHEYGGPEVLQIEDVPVPEPGPGEVLVKVAAAGVNYADTRRRLGMYVEPAPLPWTVGSEIAGTIVKLGPEVRS